MVFRSKFGRSASRARGRYGRRSNPFQRRRKTRKGLRRRRRGGFGRRRVGRGLRRRRFGGRSSTFRHRRHKRIQRIMPFKTRRRSFARFRKGARVKSVASSRPLVLRSDNSGQIIQALSGITAIREEYPLLGITSVAGSGASAYLGSVSAMFDRCLLDMAAMDPQKGTLVIGASVHTSFVPQAGTDSLQKFVWTPLNSWKYWPTSVYMKFRHVKRRTFYNPTNVVQTVFVTELRRRRAQCRCPSSAAGVPTDSNYDYEYIDQQPMFEGARTWWQPDDTTLEGVLIYAPTSQGAQDPIIRMHEAGEMYRRFLYVRFGQYEQIQLASRGFSTVASLNTGAQQFIGLNRWGIQTTFNSPEDAMGGTGPTDPEFPSLYGYNQPQSIRDNFITTQTYVDDSGNTANLTGQLNAWNGYSAENQTVTDDPSFYRLDPSYNPLRNPILRRLFHMRRVRYMIPPGGSAAHVYRTGGICHPFKSRVIRSMRFYSEDASMEPSDSAPQLPYCLPFFDGYKPTPYAHTTPKEGGWYDVSSFIQVRGQLAFTAQPPGGSSSIMQYAPARVVFHDRDDVRCRVSSYGKPAIGGVRTHTSFMCPVQTGYISTAPTAPPATQFVNLATGGLFS